MARVSGSDKPVIAYIEQLLKVAKFLAYLVSVYFGL